jgi:hypothetical protein
MTMTLMQQIEKAGITSEALDDLVHDAASRLAATANNNGLARQLNFIESAGITEAEIAEELGIHLP